MLKLILSSAIITVSFLTAFDIVKQESKKVRQIGELILVVRQMISLITFSSMDVYQLCETCFSSRKECDYSHFLSIRRDFPSEWARACELTFADIDKRVLDSLSMVSNFLGAYDSESQISGLSAVLDEITAVHAELSSKLEKNRRLYLSLGAFAGLMLCFIVI